jgi:outer membrane immunogenic protein
MQEKVNMGVVMKSSVVAAIMVVVAAGSAWAADVSAPRPAPVPVAPPPVLKYNWTGFYIGANAGYGWAREEASVTFTGGVLGGFTGTGSDDLSGGIAGGQIGFNWQTGMVVFGVEVDGQWSGQQKKNSVSCGAGCSIDETVKIKSFATARGRFGVAFDRVMPYVTGGAAWTSASDELNVTIGGVTANILNLSGNKAGWTVGGGVEVAFAGNWSAKFEYLYIDTKDLTASGTPAFLGGTVTETVRLRDNIVRAGFNYRFGPTAVTASY